MSAGQKLHLCFDKIQQIIESARLLKSKFSRSIYYGRVSMMKDRDLYKPVTEI